MVQLTAEEIDQYLDNHIPYRMRIMVALPRAVRKHLTSDQAVFDACFIASSVTARVLLNVVGIGKETTKEKTVRLCGYTPRGTDVVATHLGGTMVDVDAIPSAEKDWWLAFLKMADQSAAHFTAPAKHDWSVIYDVIKRVEELVKIHVYDGAGRRMPRY